MNDSLQSAARKLLLTGLLASLEVRLQEAQSHQLTHAQFLELLLQDELNVRQQRQIERRLKAAQFRERRTLEDFDWSFNPSIGRALVYQLATAQFVRQHRDLLLLGPPSLPTHYYFGVTC
jgi:DNA replication protein DnaC